MKKSIFLMAVAVFAMTSCTKEETLKRNEGRAIDFRIAMGTRAQTMTLGAFNYFNVTAFKGSALYFSDIRFTKQEGSGNIYNSSSDYTVYWPGDGSELTFWAYNLYNVNLYDINFTGTQATLENFTPVESIADQQDLILAGAKGTESENGTNGVELAFQHQLSQIGVKVYNQNTELKFAIAAVKFGHVKGSGNLTSTLSETAEGIKITPQWTPVDDSYVDYQVDFSSAIEFGNGGKDEKDLLVEFGCGNAMLIPQALTPWSTPNEGASMNPTVDGSYLALKLKVMNYEDGSVIIPKQGVESNSIEDGFLWIAVPLFGANKEVDEHFASEWKAGYKYVYRISLDDNFGYVAPNPDPVPDEDPYKPGQPVTAGKIKFNVVEVTEWDDSGDYLQTN